MIIFYGKGVLLGLVDNPSVHVNSMVQECFLWVLWHPCCSCVLSDDGSFVGRVIPSDWVTVRVTLNLGVWDAVQLLPTDVLLVPAETGLKEPPLSILIVWLGGLSFDVSWMQHSLCWFLVHLGVSRTGCFQVMCETSPEVSICSYQTVHCLCLCLMSLLVHVMNQSV